MQRKCSALTFSLLVVLFSLAGCVADDPYDSGGLSSVEQDGTCFALLKTSMEFMSIEDGPGNLLPVGNYSYDADCRVVSVETNGGWMFSNTTYNADGHPVVITTTSSVDGGATWMSIDTNQTWVNGLMTQTEIRGIATNYTYDANGRVTVQETLHRTYLNTTYDADGNPVMTSTSTSVDGGATFITITTNQTWVNGLMTVSETMGTETNYTYDADGRVTVQETLHRNYVNTTYDAVHGEITVIETVVTVDGGANWIVTRTHHTWGNP